MSVADPIMYSEQLFLDKGLTMAPMILKLNPFYYIAAGYVTAC